MRIATVIVPLLLGLAAAPALAEQAGAPPPRSGQGEMSYEDYLLQRAKLLLRMGGKAQQQPQKPGQPPAPDAAGKKAGSQDSSYGQGYASRKEAGGERARPERPHVERPERPHVERPGRP